MTNKEHHSGIPANIPLPEFNDAVEAFKGYPCFGDIREELFGQVARIIDAEGINVKFARNRIAQVIWQDQVGNSMRRLTPEDKMELSQEIRKEVGLKLEFHKPEKRAASQNVLKLVRSAQ